MVSRDERGTKCPEKKEKPCTQISIFLGSEVSNPFCLPIILQYFSSVLPLAKRNARKSSCGAYTKKRVQVRLQLRMILQQEEVLTTTSKEETDINARDDEDVQRSLTAEVPPPLAVAPPQQRLAPSPLKVDFP